ncbi:enoyl-CoA hydratase family protein [Marinobacter sp. GN3S48]|uniref:enoyl-CoA hydratase family protein n=1 Tax=Marinobacter sp. GN3S48 TaxID=3382302 RepID=UPI00387AEA1C
MAEQKKPFQGYRASHFKWDCSEDGRVGVITLSRPEKKNALNISVIAELTQLFDGLSQANDVRAVIITGDNGDFCSGGDLFEVVEPLTKMGAAELLDFTRMMGKLVRVMRQAPQVIIAAIEGACAGGGAAIALAADLRLGTPNTKTAYLFNQIGLSGADMGACGLLPRIIGQGRAMELLMTGRAMTADEGLAWGFFNALYESDELVEQAHVLARRFVDGPWFAHTMTKSLVNQEWTMSLDEILESEAKSQAICLATGDFQRAFTAFSNKERPSFEGH